MVWAGSRRGVTKGVTNFICRVFGARPSLARRILLSSTSTAGSHHLIPKPEIIQFHGIYTKFSNTNLQLDSR